MFLGFRGYVQYSACKFYFVRFSPCFFAASPCLAVEGDVFHLTIRWNRAQNFDAHPGARLLHSRAFGIQFCRDAQSTDRGRKGV